MKIFFLAALSGLFVYSTLSAEPIRIGVITDLSGVARDFGIQTRAGATLAAEDLRKEGKDVEIIIEDSKFSTREALNAANKLLLVDKVEGFYVDFTPLAAAVAPILESRKKIFLYGAAVNSILSNHYAFRFYSDYERGCELLAETLMKRGVTKPAFLRAEFEYGDLCGRGARRVFPDLIEKPYARGDAIPTEIASLRQKKVDAVMNASFVDDTINMLKAMRTNSLRVPVATAEENFPPDVIREFLPWIDGSITFSIDFDRGFFAAKVQSLNESNPPDRFEGVALAWGHLRQLHEALLRCRPSHEADCAVRELERAPETPQTAFIRWENRSARYRYRLGTFSGGMWKQLERRE